MVESFLQTRKSLRLVVLILDSRRGAARGDLNLLDWLNAHRIPSLLVLTKADRLSQLERAQQKKNLDTMSLTRGKPFVFFSATNGEGKEELWKLIQAALV